MWLNIELSYVTRTSWKIDEKSMHASPFSPSSVYRSPGLFASTPEQLGAHKVTILIPVKATCGFTYLDSSYFTKWIILLFFILLTIHSLTHQTFNPLVYTSHWAKSWQQRHDGPWFSPATESSASWLVYS